MIAALDTSVFDTVIWRPLPPSPPPPPAPPPTDAPPLAPLRIALLGIDYAPDGVLRAAIYDYQSDSVLLMRSGDRVQDRVLREVTTSGIELASAQGEVLRLTMEDGSASAPSPRRGGAR